MFFIIIIKYKKYLKIIYIFYCDSASVLKHMHYYSLSMIPLWCLKNGDSDIAHTLRDSTLVFISLEGAEPQAEGQL